MRNRSGGANTQETNEGINPDTVGVVFAWICAALYLGSRVPQIFLNVRGRARTTCK